MHLKTQSTNQNDFLKNAQITHRKGEKLREIKNTENKLKGQTTNILIITL